MKNSRKTGLSIVGSALALGLVSPASGAQREHGSVCSGVTSQSANLLAYSAIDGIRNVSSTATPVIACPMGNLAANASGGVAMRIIDANDNFDVGCTMFAVSSSAGIVWTQSKTATGIANGDLSFTVPASPSTRTLYAQCGLPPFTSVANVFTNP